MEPAAETPDPRAGDRIVSLPRTPCPACSTRRFPARNSADAPPSSLRGSEICCRDHASFSRMPKADSLGLFGIVLDAGVTASSCVSRDYGGRRPAPERQESRIGGFPWQDRIRHFRGIRVRMGWRFAIDRCFSYGRLGLKSISSITHNTVPKRASGGHGEWGPNVLPNRGSGSTT